MVKLGPRIAAKLIPENGPVHERLYSCVRIYERSSICLTTPRWWESPSQHTPVWPLTIWNSVARRYEKGRR
jgi:hypothetical protein